MEVFLSPPASSLDGFMLGDSPFFTSVPSGRVGSGHESVYRSNDEFKQVTLFLILNAIVQWPVYAVEFVAYDFILYIL